MSSPRWGSAASSPRRAMTSACSHHAASVAGPRRPADLASVTARTRVLGRGRTSGGGSARLRRAHVLRLRAGGRRHGRGGGRPAGRGRRGRAPGDRAVGCRSAAAPERGTGPHPGHVPRRRRAFRDLGPRRDERRARGPRPRSDRGGSDYALHCAPGPLHARARGTAGGARHPRERRTERRPRRADRRAGAAPGRPRPPLGGDTRGRSSSSD